MVAPASSLRAEAGREEDAWSPMNLKAGQIDGKLNLKVDEVILQTDEFVVYLDDKLTTQWHILGAHLSTGPVLNRVAELEAIPIGFLPEPVRRSFRSLVAEGLARAFDEDNAASAEAIHASAEKYIRARLAEQARVWYLTSAFVALIIAGGIMGAVEILFRSGIVGMTDPIRRFLLSLGMGALGAGFSLVARMGSFPADPSAGRELHSREAVARIIMGIIGAFVGYLAISTKLFFPNLSDGDLAGILLVSFVAGTSERFVPSLVARVEGGGNEATAKPDGDGQKSVASMTVERKATVTMTTKGETEVPPKTS